MYVVPENPQEKTGIALEKVRFGKNKVFSRRKMVVPESVQVQDSNPDPENEVPI